MSGLPTPEATPNCNACPIATGVALGELASQLVQPEEWLMNPPELVDTQGLFTADAVRTAVRRHRLDVVADSPTYGIPAPYTPQEAGLWFMRRELQAGPYLNAGQVETLQEAAARRQAEQEAFAALPEGARTYFAQVAEPHLLKASKALASRGPDDAVLRAMEDELRGQHAGMGKFEAVSAGLSGVEVFGKLDAFDKLYMPDQLPFQLAKTAVEDCDGPWLLAKKRLIGRPVVKQVCPNGPHDNTWRMAEYAHDRTPREPRI